MPKISPTDFDSPMYAETKDLLGDGFSALLDRYFSGAQKHLAIIDQALEKSEVDTISGITHNIKSNSASFGFRRVANIAETMEQLCRQTPPAPITEVSRLHTQLKEALLAIESAYRGGELS